MGNRALIRVLSAIVFFPGALFLLVSDSCHSGWEYYEGYCYLFAREMDTWSEAESHCKAFNADLVDIRDGNENSFIRSHLIKMHPGSSANQVCYYTSGTDLAEEGKWVWAPHSDPFEFTSWGVGEPRGVGQENCVCISGFRGFEWADVDCHQKYNFICKASELDVSPGPIG